MDQPTELDATPLSRPVQEPAWAEAVRANVSTGGPVGPPPVEIPAAMAAKFNLARPFVELTLVEHGRYVGPTKGRVIDEDDVGFDFLTREGLYFVTWANLAYWTYLSET